MAVQETTSGRAARLTASGDCEEASALLGEVIASGPELSNEIVRFLVRVQNDLADVSEDISVIFDDGGSEGPAVRVDEGYVARLERACEHFGADLPTLSVAAIPGGTTPAATLFHARTAVRRAERAVQEAVADARLNPLVEDYLDQLGDMLLILARTANLEHGDTLWQPGMTAKLGTAELWEPMPEPDEESP